MMKRNASNITLWFFPPVDIDTRDEVKERVSSSSNLLNFILVTDGVALTKTR